MISRSSHTWRFFRVGGFDQVKLETGADLMNLEQLDQKLWVALADTSDINKIFANTIFKRRKASGRKSLLS